MCDTIYAGKELSPDGSAWFAKNSDRSPDEPQPLCILPRRGAGGELLVGGRAFPGKDAGYAILLSKPTWIAGGEAGVNERGVAIGNEAVFSKWAPAKDGVLGMDILRAALASSGSAEEAVSYIAECVERLEQGGNGAFQGKLFYDNSYIAADRERAFVLESAGKRWAIRELHESATISNAYSITDDYDRLDAVTSGELESAAGRKSWKARVQRSLYLRFTKGEERRRFTRAALEERCGSLDLDAVLGALRSHGAYTPGKRGSMASPCVHEGGFPVNNATTASMAVSFPPGGASPVIWFSGTSYPCLSLFKPVVLEGGEFVPLWTDYDYMENSPAAIAHWTHQREWVKSRRIGELSLNSAFRTRRDMLQKSLEEIARDASRRGTASGQGLEARRQDVNEIIRSWYSGIAVY
jgi:hypothetical protein